jgi:hypothetical protein
MDRISLGWTSATESPIPQGGTTPDANRESRHNDVHGRLGDGAPSYGGEPVCQWESEYVARERRATIVSARVRGHLVDHKGRRYDGLGMCQWKPGIIFEKALIHTLFHD